MYKGYAYCPKCAKGFESKLTIGDETGLICKFCLNIGRFSELPFKEVK